MPDLVLWPPGLPTPMRDGYAYESQDLAIRSEREAGPARVRRRFTSGPTMFQVKFRLAGQIRLAVFEGFYRHDLLDGASWFMIDLETGRGLLPHVCRFKDVPKRAAVAPGVYDVTATIEVEEAATLSAEDYAAIRDMSRAELEAFDRTRDDLDQLVNVELPGMGVWKGEQ